MSEAPLQTPAPDLIVDARGLVRRFHAHHNRGGCGFEGDGTRVVDSSFHDISDIAIYSGGSSLARSDLRDNQFHVIGGTTSNNVFGRASAVALLGSLVTGA